MAQRTFPVGTVLSSPFGGTITVSDPNQFFSEQYVPKSSPAPTQSSAPAYQAPAPSQNYQSPSMPVQGIQIQKIQQGNWSAVLGTPGKYYVLANGQVQGGIYQDKNSAQAAASQMAPYFGDFSPEFNAQTATDFVENGEGRGKLALLQQNSAPQPQAEAPAPTNNVNASYQEYFGRDATPAESANWQKESPQALSSFLQNEQVKYGVAPTQPQQQQEQAPALDFSGFTQAMIESINAARDYTKLLQEQGKRVNPDITINQAKLDEFTAKAASELGPKYQTMFSQAKSDLERAAARAQQDYSASEKNLGQQYGQQLEQTQEGFARRGLAFSSERDKAEKMLADRADTALQGLQQNTQRAVEDAGTQAVREFGSRNLPTSFNFQTGASAIRNQPGVYGFSPSTQTRNLFTTPQDVTGTQEYQKQYEEANRVKKLSENELETRSLTQTF